MPATIFPAPGFTSSSYNAVDIAGGADLIRTTSVQGKFTGARVIGSTSVILAGRLRTAEVARASVSEVSTRQGVIRTQYQTKGDSVIIPSRSSPPPIIRTLKPLISGYDLYRLNILNFGKASSLTARSIIDGGFFRTAVIKSSIGSLKSVAFSNQVARISKVGISAISDLGAGFNRSFAQLNKQIEVIRSDSVRNVNILGTLSRQLQTRFSSTVPSSSIVIGSLQKLSQTYKFSGITNTISTGKANQLVGFKSLPFNANYNYKTSVSSVPVTNSTGPLAISGFTQSGTSITFNLSTPLTSAIAPYSSLIWSQYGYYSYINTLLTASSALAITSYTTNSITVNSPYSLAPLTPTSPVGETTFLTTTSGGVYNAGTNSYSFTWTVPASVTSVSVVCVGGGGNGGGANGGAGGGGGGLGFKNNITVVPGQNYTVVVGAGGVALAGVASTGTPGGDSYFVSSTLVKGGGGGGGGFGSNVGQGGTWVGDGGGNGGNGGAAIINSGGGGGAGGYGGPGGNGGDGGGTNPTAGSNGGGGGGATSTQTYGNGNGTPSGGGGGGVGLQGQGPSGAAGVTSNSYAVAGTAGGGGSGGGGGTDGTANFIQGNAGGLGGLYGGGAAGSNGAGNGGGYIRGFAANTGNGAVRIIWGGIRYFPTAASTYVSNSQFVTASFNTNVSVSTVSTDEVNLITKFKTNTITVEAKNISGKLKTDATLKETINQLRTTNIISRSIGRPVALLDYPKSAYPTFKHRVTAIPNAQSNPVTVSASSITYGDLIPVTGLSTSGNVTTFNYASNPLANYNYSYAQLVGTSLTYYNQLTYTSYSTFFSTASTYVSYPGSATPSGTGDFTVEGWIYLTDVTANKTKMIISNNANGGLFIRIGTNYQGSINGINICGYNVFDGEYCNYNFAINTWYYIAVVRASANIYFYVNGLQQQTNNPGGPNYARTYNYVNSGSTYIGGGDTALEPFIGWINNIRVTNQALYTPTSFPFASNTSLALGSVSGTTLTVSYPNSDPSFLLGAQLYAIGTSTYSSIATGGTVGYSSLNGGVYINHTFTANGVFTLLQDTTFDILLVGGGGGGGRYGGGGGAGGYLALNLTLKSGIYNISIGAGGTGSSPTVTPANNGQDTTISNYLGTVLYTALGGGRGGQSGVNPGGDGGSGGGGGSGDGSFLANPAGNATQPTSAWGGFGNAGGVAESGNGNYSGGGGGAGGTGASGPSGGNGGIGRQWVDGNYYAGGGGGGGWLGHGIGGAGGGGTNTYQGAGANNPGGNGTNGLGGGGSGAGLNGTGGTGGSGTVIFRVKVSLSTPNLLPTPLTLTAGGPTSFTVSPSAVGTNYYFANPPVPITVPTTNLTASAYTSLLTLNTQNFADLSPNNYTPTTNNVFSTLNNSPYTTYVTLPGPQAARFRLPVTPLSVSVTSMTANVGIPNWTYDNLYLQYGVGYTTSSTSYSYSDRSLPPGKLQISERAKGDNTTIALGRVRSETKLITYDLNVNLPRITKTSQFVRPVDSRTTLLSSVINRQIAKMNGQANDAVQLRGGVIQRQLQKMNMPAEVPRMGKTSSFISLRTLSYNSNFNFTSTLSTLSVPNNSGQLLVTTATQSGSNLVFNLSGSVANPLYSYSTLNFTTVSYQNTITSSSINLPITSRTNSSLTVAYPATFTPAGQVVFDVLSGGTYSAVNNTYTYSWTAPAGVTSVSVVCVGGGGCGATGGSPAMAVGGGGGALAWINNVTVTPGTSYTVTVGAGGTESAPDGGSSWFINTSTILAGGGTGGRTNNAGVAGGTYSVSNSYGTSGGGNGGGTAATTGTGSGYGGGGGGAGGYSGTGGTGGGPGSTSSGIAPTAGSGGAGGGGGAGYDLSNAGTQAGSGGGGVGILGSGSNGTAGTNVQQPGPTVPGGGGSGGAAGTANVGTRAGNGGTYGGGGGGYPQSGFTGIGGPGVVKIVWGTTRSYPSTNIAGDYKQFVSAFGTANVTVSSTTSDQVNLMNRAKFNLLTNTTPSVSNYTPAVAITSYTQIDTTTVRLNLASNFVNQNYNTVKVSNLTTQSISSTANIVPLIPQNITPTTPGSGQSTGFTTIVQTGTNNDNGYFTVSLPFNINFYGTTYNTVYVGTNGYISFGSGSSNSTTYPAGLDIIAFAFGDHYTSSISYYYVNPNTVTSPNRIYGIAISANTLPNNTGTPIYAEFWFYENNPTTIDVYIGANGAYNLFSGAGAQAFASGAYQNGINLNPFQSIPYSWFKLICSNITSNISTDTFARIYPIYSSTSNSVTIRTADTLPAISNNPTVSFGITSTATTYNTYSDIELKAYTGRFNIVTRSVPNNLQIGISKSLIGLKLPGRYVGYNADSGLITRLTVKSNLDQVFFSPSLGQLTKQAEIVKGTVTPLAIIKGSWSAKMGGNTIQLTPAKISINPKVGSTANISNILTSRVENTVLQSTVSITTAPSNSRERLYYAVLAPGRYGLTTPVIGRTLAAASLVDKVDKITSYTGAGFTPSNKIYVISPGFTPGLSKLAVSEKVRGQIPNINLSLVTTFIAQSTVTPLTYPSTPREVLYYAQLAPGFRTNLTKAFGRTISGDTVQIAAGKIAAAEKVRAVAQTVDIGTRLSTFNNSNLTAAPLSVGTISLNSGVAVTGQTARTTNNITDYYTNDGDLIAEVAVGISVMTYYYPYNSSFTALYPSGSTVYLYNANTKYLQSVVLLTSTATSVSFVAPSNIPNNNSAMYIIGSTNTFTATFSTSTTNISYIPYPVNNYVNITDASTLGYNQNVQVITAGYNSFTFTSSLTLFIDIINFGYILNFANANLDVYPSLYVTTNSSSPIRTPREMLYYATMGIKQAKVGFNPIFLQSLSTVNTGFIPRQLYALKTYPNNIFTGNTALKPQLISDINAFPVPKLRSDFSLKGVIGLPISPNLLTSTRFKVFNEVLQIRFTQGISRQIALLRTDSNRYLTSTVGFPKIQFVPPKPLPDISYLKISVSLRDLPRPNFNISAVISPRRIPFVDLALRPTLLSGKFNIRVADLTPLRIDAKIQTNIVLRDLPIVRNISQISRQGYKVASVTTIRYSLLRSVLTKASDPNSQLVISTEGLIKPKFGYGTYGLVDIAVPKTVPVQFWD